MLAHRASCLLLEGQVTIGESGGSAVMPEALALPHPSPRCKGTDKATLEKPARLSTKANTRQASGWAAGWLHTPVALWVPALEGAWLHRQQRAWSP